MEFFFFLNKQDRHDDKNYHNKRKVWTENTISAITDEGKLVRALRDKLPMDFCTAANSLSELANSDKKLLSIFPS